MKKIVLLLIALPMACHAPKKKIETPEAQPVPEWRLEQANRLASLPMQCIEKEYPNKLGQVLGEAKDLKPPRDLHPAFYGCFDWHSAVHGHWSLVSLLKQFPDLAQAKAIRQKLLHHLSKENIAKEVEYFSGVHNKNYERTYGWAWLLKLAETLHTWQDSTAQTLEQNLQPLTNLIVRKYLAFLPQLKYPIRVGTHTNTAFGLAFAWDYAHTVGNDSLQQLIAQRAKDFYLNDTDCPMAWEPGGYDFLSPCLQEAALMKRILSKEAFRSWLSKFLPTLKDQNFSLAVGEVSDRADGHLVHLDGVNFSRAWALNKIKSGLPEYSHLANIANEHIRYALPNLVGDSYEGGHWLGSFAIYAMSNENSTHATPR